MNSQWQEYYRRYRTLLREWHWPDAPQEFQLQTFRTAVTSATDPEICVNEMHRWGFGPPNTKQMDEALRVREAVLKLPSGWFPEEPLEDVYQAALRMETYEPWHGDQGRRRVYRGQRDYRWQVVPSLFRRVSSAADRSRTEYLKTTLHRVAGFVRLLQAGHPGMSEEEGLAIVQHYSGEIGVGTWLIDYSWDPFVALFFASDGGQAGEIGCVSYLGMGEWTRFSAGGTNRLGRVRVIEPRGVPRIAAQRALFLDTSHPDLLDQFVPFILYFRQTPGLVFEDAGRETPITRSILYPDPDPYKTALMDGGSLAGEIQPLVCQPASDASSPLTGDDYWQIVESWYRHEGTEPPVNAKDILMRVCLAYSYLQSPEARAKIPVDGRSLHRLQEAVERVRVFKIAGIAEVLETWLQRTNKPITVETIQEIIRRVSNDIHN